MARIAKIRATFTLMPENYEWLKQLANQTGIPMSLFLDSMLTGVRVSVKDGVNDREAMSMAFEQIAKGIRK
jgi:hypothetical protein